MNYLKGLQKGSTVLLKLILLSAVLAVMVWTVPSNLTSIEATVSEIQGASQAEVV